MNGFVYVYILESLGPARGFYVGLTDILAARLATCRNAILRVAVAFFRPECR